MSFQTGDPKMNNFCSTFTNKLTTQKIGILFFDPKCKRNINSTQVYSGKYIIRSYCIFKPHTKIRRIY